MIVLALCSLNVCFFLFLYTWNIPCLLAGQPKGWEAYENVESLIVTYANCSSFSKFDLASLDSLHHVCHGFNPGIFRFPIWESDVYENKLN